MSCCLDKLGKSQKLADNLIKIVKSDKKKRMEFMENLMQDKSKLNDYFHKIISSFTAREDFCKWYYEYLLMYSEWFRKSFEEKSLQEVLALVPCISPWAFEGKCKEREMGLLPEVFGRRADFQKFCERLLKSSAFKAFAKVKDMEVQETLAKTTNHKKDLLREKQQKVTALLKEKMGQNLSLKCGKTKFDIQPMFNPFSNKVVLRLSTEKGDRYILKISPYNNPHIVTDMDRKAHENQLIRADSPYSNACVDFYLKYNGCKGASEVLYYDFIYDAVLYKESDCKSYHYPDKMKVCKDVIKFNLTELKCVSDLGLYLNDVREENLLVNKKSNNIELIDSGHMSYISPLNPGCPGYTYTMGNLCGRDSMGHFAVVMTWLK